MTTAWLHVSTAGVPWCSTQLKLHCARCDRTAALGADRSSYKVDVAVVYIAATNGLVKKAIERGAPLSRPQRQ